MGNNVEKNECTCCRKKIRDEAEHRDLINRLSRIEGQIRGIRKMVEDDCYCTDIITQVSAASSALNSFNKELLSRHIKTCVSDDVRAGKEETVDELCAVIAKLMK
ncbi:MAG: metal-sensing transcriptional repressor [Ruminococcaceae bacterium]|nr:metal-sensing transcriptional repressor [Oscillospiraceae bacterium]